MFRAFRELGTCRPVGMSMGPIPITAMFAYVDRYRLPEWSLDALMRIDQDWLELLSKENGKHD